MITLKILVLTSEYPPEGDSLAVHYFTKEWVKEAQDVHVFFDCERLVFPLCKFASQKEKRNPAGKKERYELDGVKVIKVPLRRITPKVRVLELFSVIKARRSFNDYIRKNGPFDVIVNHFCTNNYFLIKKNSYVKNIPIVSVFHRCDTDNLNEAIKVLAVSDSVFARSWKICDFLRNEACYMGKVQCLLSGIPESYIKEYSKKKKSSMLSILFVGKLMKQKNVQDIINALSCLDKKINYTFEIVGEGLEADYLKSLVKEKGLESKVFFSGKLPRNEVVKKMQNADCFVMTSRNETLGLVYLEAMAAGCLVIGSRGEGIDGIIVNKKNGFLVTPGNVEELADRLSEIANMEEAEFNSIREQSYNTIKDFTEENIAKKYLESISNVKKSWSENID